MAALPTLSPQVRRILQLSRDDPAAARDAMAALGIEAQTALICEAPVSRRSELIDLAPEPERLIPALPPAELCFTAKAVGLPDAGWLIEYATAEQIAACLDLDTWQDFVPDRSKLDEWLKAFADSGDETLLRSTRAMDLELLVLQMKSRISVLLKPNEEGLVEGLGGRVTVLNDNVEHGYTRDTGVLTEYDIVIADLTGPDSTGRKIDTIEGTALYDFVDLGGKLLLTGPNVLASPDNQYLATIVGSSSVGRQTLSTDRAQAVSASPEFGQLPLSSTHPHLQIAAHHQIQTGKEDPHPDNKFGLTALPDQILLEVYD